MTNRFVHLHNHTQFSLLDGAIRLNPLYEKAKEFNMPAIAMTDHGNMFGTVDFYRLSKKYNIKSIIGCEMYIAPKSRFDKKGTDRVSDTSRHLTLLARNREGYQNLIKLVSIGHLEGFYYKPRIDKEVLRKHSKGIIALSGCFKGEVSRFLHDDKEAEAKQAALEYLDIIDEGSFFIEIHNQFLDGQVELTKKLVRLAKELSIPLAAANDCHYLEKKDAKAHDALLCIQTGRLLKEEKRLKFSTDEFYFKSQDEMFDLFKDTPEALENTVKIAEMCDLDFEFGKFHMPDYDVPKGLSLDDYLEKLSLSGLLERLKAIKDPDIDLYKARLKEELGIIKDMGYSGYFLIVWDFIDYARQNNIPVGPGRGSAAGSLVAYSLKITNIDPIRYGLIFERFLNPERVSMPDIDVDFCMDKRDRVIDYTVKKYGTDNVTQIITFGSMLAKGVIRDVGRVMDMPYSEVDSIAKLVPNKLGITLSKAIEEEKEFKILRDSDKNVNELLETALTLEGLSRHASTHAAGIVISPKPLVEYIPLYKNSKNNDIVTQFPMGDIERLGLLKMDFLGLKTLTVIDKALKMVKISKGIDIDPDLLPIDDEKTYNLLCDAKTMGVFQLESVGMRDLLRKFKPNCFEDIIAIIALYRPGPLNSGMVDDYIKRKHGTSEVKYELPQLEAILKETYGVIVYQEQVMKIARVLAGYSLGEADIVRRTMGKKKVEEIPKLKKSFLEGAKKGNIDLKKAEKIFDLMAHFAEYGFNKSHSAAYALVTYQTAYLKAHYPDEYMASLLTGEMGNTDKVIEYINECREMDVTILPPDINESFTDFTVTDHGVRFGLEAIKNVGRAAVENIIKVREKEGKFKSFVDFSERVDLRTANKKVLENLIKCGAMDSLGNVRASMIMDIERVTEYALKTQRDRDIGQMSFFGDSNISTSDTTIEFVSSNVDEYDEKEKLLFEKEALGFYITGHPLIPYESYLKRFTNINTKNLADNQSENAVIAGIISQLKEKITRKGDKMAFFMLEDLHGSAEVIVFPELFKSSRQILSADEPILVTGSVEASGGDPKILAKELTPISKMNDQFNNVHINLNTVGMEKDTLFRLRDIFINHRGKNSVLLHFQMPNKSRVSISASADFKINPSNGMLSMVEEITGNNTVYFE